MRVIDRILMILIMITILGIAIALFMGYHNTSTSTYDNSNIEKKIDSLSSIRDSVKVNIATTDTAIYNNKTIYVKERDNIISQSPDSDMQFFTNYIREVGRKLLIDTISIKSN